MRRFIHEITVGFFLFGLASTAVHDSYAASILERKDGTVIDYYLEATSSGLSADTLLVFFQGSDCNSVKHNNLIRELSQAIWPSADLLLIEKPGITSSLPRDSNAERSDCPSYYLKNDCPEQRVQDANKVVSEIAKNERYKNVIVLGGSEGAVVAALFAAEYGIADAIVMINGGSRWFIDDVTHNIKSTSPANEVKSALEGFNGFTKHILNSEAFEIEVSNHGYAWWKSVLTLDQKSVLTRVAVPTLVIQGGRDKSVSPEAVTELVTELYDSGSNNIELMSYPEMNHKLLDPNGRQMTQEISGYIKGWLKTALESNSDKIIESTR